jgi:hypothetical protein
MRSVTAVDVTPWILQDPERKSFRAVASSSASSSRSILSDVQHLSSFRTFLSDVQHLPCFLPATMRSRSSYPPLYRNNKRVHPLLRPLHALRSCAVPITLSLLFGFLLASLLLLSEPSKPARKLGWQSWDLILAVEGGNGTAGNETTVNDGGEVDDQVAGWKDASLPLDVWDPLLPHRTG